MGEAGLMAGLASGASATAVERKRRPKAGPAGACVLTLPSCCLSRVDAKHTTFSLDRRARMFLHRELSEDRLQPRAPRGNWPKGRIRQAAFSPPSSRHVPGESQQVRARNGRRN